MKCSNYYIFRDNEVERLLDRNANLVSKILRLTVVGGIIIFMQHRKVDFLNEQNRKLQSELNALKEKEQE